MGEIEKLIRKKGKGFKDISIENALKRKEERWIKYIEKRIMMRYNLKKPPYLAKPAIFFQLRGFKKEVSDFEIFGTKVIRLPLNINELTIKLYKISKLKMNLDTLFYITQELRRRTTELTQQNCPDGYFYLIIPPKNR